VRGRTGLGVTWRAARRLCADPAFVAALVMMAASRWSATGVRFSLVPLFASEVVGLGDAAVGYAVGIAAVAQLLVLWPVGRASDLVGRRAVGVPAYGRSGWWPRSWARHDPGGLLRRHGPLRRGDRSDLGDPARGGRRRRAAGGHRGGHRRAEHRRRPRQRAGALASGLLVDLVGCDWGFGAAAALLLVAAGFAARLRETLPRAPG